MIKIEWITTVTSFQVFPTAKRAKTGAFGYLNSIGADIASRTGYKFPKHFVKQTSTMSPYFTSSNNEKVYIHHVYWKISCKKLNFLITLQGSYKIMIRQSSTWVLMLTFSSPPEKKPNAMSWRWLSNLNLSDPTPVFA